MKQLPVLSGSSRVRPTPQDLSIGAGPRTETAWVPDQIVLEVTYRCNLRCKMCWWWGSSGIVHERENLHDELSLFEWQAFIDSVTDFRPHIKITGGEPFVRRDVLDLIEYITGAGLTCSIITNGTRLGAPELQRLVRSGLAQINISLNGGAQTDSEIRGRGAFEQTLATISTLARIRSDEGVAHPDILVNCVVTSDTIVADLYELRAALLDLEVPLRIQHLMWTDDAHCASHEAALLATMGIVDPTLRGFLLPTSKINVEELLAFLQTTGAIEGTRGDPIHSLPRLNAEEVKCWYADPAFPRSGGCGYVQRTARVKANGEVVGCPYIDYPFGNVREQPFPVIYRNPRALSFRATLAAELLPGCAHCCKQ